MAINTTMTFQPDGGDVPLSWGQFLIKANKAQKTAPRTKTTKKTEGTVPFGSLPQRVAVALLIALNIGLVGVSWTSRTHADQVEQTRQVQALVAPTPVADSIQIQPIQEPTAIVASVEVEKVEPTPTPTKAVAAASVSRTTPLVGDWDALLQQYFASNWIKAKKVMLCESGGNTRAVGPMDSNGFQPIGLFQIKNFAGRPSTEALMDAITNITYAAKMSGAGSNWSAWACKPY
jgi:hypothetical protein